MGTFQTPFNLKFLPMSFSGVTSDMYPKSILVEGSTDLLSWSELYQTTDLEKGDQVKEDNEKGDQVKELLFDKNEEKYKHYRIRFILQDDATRMQVGHYGIIQAYTKQCTSHLYFELTGNKIIPYKTPAPTPKPTTAPVVHTLTKGQIIDQIVETTNEWTLSFQLHPKGKVNNYANIIRFTNTNNDCCNPGDMWINMFFFPDSYTIMFYAQTTESDLSYVDGVVESDAWYDIKAHADSDEITFYINGVKQGTLPNTNRPSLKDVKVYASDNFYSPANALMRDYKFTASKK